MRGKIIADIFGVFNVLMQRGVAQLMWASSSSCTLSFIVTMLSPPSQFVSIHHRGPVSVMQTKCHITR